MGIYNGKDLISHDTNTRVEAEEIFKDEDETLPLFGIEHEFFVKSKGVPLGYFGDETSEQGRYYCSVGHGNSY